MPQKLSGVSCEAAAGVLDGNWSSTRSPVCVSSVPLDRDGSAKVLSGILLAVDQGDLTLLTLFDLSAAFDTVDNASLRRCVIWTRWIGPPLAHHLPLLPQRPHPVRPLRLVQIVTRALLFGVPASIGLRTDPILALHSGPHTTGGKPRPASAPLRRRYTGVRVLSALRPGSRMTPVSLHR